MRAPKQANLDAQKELDDVINDKPKDITLSNGKKVKIGWMKPDTQDKIDEILLDYETYKKDHKQEENSINKDLVNGNKITRQYYAKSAAAILINNYFGLRLIWWLKWRIIYHFWNLNGQDYVQIVTEAKKKATEQQYYLAMVYLMTMSDVWTTMTKKEAEAYHRELESAKGQAS